MGARQRWILKARNKFKKYSHFKIIILFDLTGLLVLNSFRSNTVYIFYVDTINAKIVRHTMNFYTYYKSCFHKAYYLNKTTTKLIVIIIKLYDTAKNNKTIQNFNTNASLNMSYTINYYLDRLFLTSSAMHIIMVDDDEMVASYLSEHLI